MYNFEYQKNEFQQKIFLKKDIFYSKFVISSFI